MKPWCVIIKIKAIEQYVHMVVFVYLKIGKTELGIHVVAQ